VEIQDYPDGTPSAGDKIPFVEDPAGTPALKLADLADVGGGGGGGSWTQVINQDGSSLTDWTVLSGTWAVVSAVIECQTAGAGQDIYLTTPTFDSSDWLFECELQINNLAGYVGPGACIRSGSDVTGSLEINLHSNTVIAVSHGVAAASDIPAPMVADTWTVLRIRYVGASATVWLDGACMGAVTMTDVPVGNQLMLRSYGTTSKWRNVKVWEAGALPT
jgi:hypothetical protein